MTVYLSLLPKELNTLIDLYISHIKICASLLVHYSGNGIMDCVNSIVNHVDLIIIGICTCCKDNSHIYSKLYNDVYNNKVKKENGGKITIVGPSDSVRGYTELLREVNSVTTRLINGTDPKDTYLWYTMIAEPTNSYNLESPDIFREKLAAHHYGHENLYIPGISLCKLIQK